MWTFFSSTDISFTVHSTDVVITHTTSHVPLWKMWRMSSQLEFHRKKGRLDVGHGN
jgi:hypothetical protein